MRDQWTPERSDRLAALHGQEGEPSFVKMAAQINSEFGTSFSRNACIGRARRLGLAKRFPSVKSSFERQKPRKRKPITDTNILNRIARAQTIEQPLLRCVPIVPRNLTLAELDQSNECHWIEGSDHLYCGHPVWSYLLAGVQRNSSYCRQHHELTLRAPFERAKLSRLVA